MSGAYAMIESHKIKININWNKDKKLNVNPTKGPIQMDTFIVDRSNSIIMKT